MPFSAEIEAFIRDFVKDLRENNAAIFAGAGLSKSCGYVDWPELLRDIADELELNVDIEHDLISLAQFHVNEKKGPAKLARKILEEFSEQAQSSASHDILARLPIRTYWTTNYDTLIEQSLRRAYKVVDVKYSVDQLNTTTPKRDAVVYKMHGDVTHPNDAVLYKEQYEKYYATHSPFVTALSGDLVSKTFLFIGFSFTDPNLDYVLSRLHSPVRRHHYCFMKREPLVPEDRALSEYRARKQRLRIDDLKRFGIQTLLVGDYAEIPLILEEIETRFLKKTIFISGSAEEFGDWSRIDAQGFVHQLSAQLIESGFRVVNGFGWGIGSAVINGALEAIYANPGRLSEDQLVMRPFPQFGRTDEELRAMWEEYRQRMISLAGIGIFLFGNKKQGDAIVAANGVIREWEIAVEKGRITLPIGATGFAAASIWQRMNQSPDDYALLNPIWKKLEKVCAPDAPRENLAKEIVQLIQQLSK